ncbi:PEP-CTERM sorting domain-containing protein [Pelomonas sp. KK5]|uniref:PEP-CTERM sorting domain-containing protein n=1 Tax=Pelomonas sp. KK5 TaxID=1855730 RepID=UPI00097BFC0E|nr:PEP-CTERM sorting domain-containing protein [Pelomonas sp. KK5]
MLKKKSIPLSLAMAALAASTGAAAAGPQYTIVDLGALSGDVSQAFSISANGANIGGRSFNDTFSTPATWSAAKGTMTALPELPSRMSARVNGINNAGTAVGTASVTVSGLNPLPVVWQNGSATQLQLPTGISTGRATAISNNGLIVGSAGGGTNQIAAIYSTKGAATVMPKLANGGWMVDAMGVSDTGLVIGTGFDPDNQARNAALVYDTTTGITTDLGAVAGKNGAIPFAITGSGNYIAGVSSQNQGSGVPFIWSAATGMQAIPLLDGTGYGQATGVNSSGWAVGSDGGLYSNPFLWADGTLYSVASLVTDASWDFSYNTASSAYSISDNGTIVGTAYHNGVAHAYEMVLTSAVPEPGSWALMAAGLAAVAGVARRRSRSSSC